MQLSKKSKKHFAAFLFAIYIKYWAFSKNEPHSLSILEVIDSETRSYLNNKISLFENIVS